MNPIFTRSAAAAGVEESTAASTRMIKAFGTMGFLPAGGFVADYNPVRGYRAGQAPGEKLRRRPRGHRVGGDAQRPPARSEVASDSRAHLAPREERHRRRPAHPGRRLSLPLVRARAVH